MFRKLPIPAALILNSALLLLSGCLFNYSRVPYTIDLNNTPVAAIEADGKVIKLKEPFSGYGIYTEINTNAIGDIAKKHGLKEVYFADMEVLSILGIYQHNMLYIYGR